MTPAELPTRDEVKRALVPDAIRARRAAEARARLAAACDALNASGSTLSAAQRVAAVHELNRLRLAVFTAAGRRVPYWLRQYV